MENIIDKKGKKLIKKHTKEVGINWIYNWKSHKDNYGHIDRHHIQLSQLILWSQINTEEKVLQDIWEKNKL